MQEEYAKFEETNELRPPFWILIGVLKRVRSNVQEGKQKKLERIIFCLVFGLSYRD